MDVEAAQDVGVRRPQVGQLLDGATEIQARVREDELDHALLAVLRRAADELAGRRGRRAEVELRSGQIVQPGFEAERGDGADAVSYTHLRAHETPEHLVCRLLLEKKKNT